MSENITYRISNGGELEVHAEGFKSAKCTEVLAQLRKHLESNGIKSNVKEQDLMAEAHTPYLEEKGSEVFVHR
jgi:hypothetical protein